MAYDDLGYEIKHFRPGGPRNESGCVNCGYPDYNHAPSLRRTEVRRSGHDLHNDPPHGRYPRRVFG